MRINADLAQRAVVDSEELDWVASPAAGVWRRMLERDGEEVGCATSIVRFDPGASFPVHEYGGGEEFLVLSGVFQDEAGDYPAGSYVRHPVGSSHSAWSEPGCIILVKLCQMDPADQTTVKTDARAADAPWVASGLDGLDRLHLHEFGDEKVWLTRMAPGAVAADHDHPGGEEVFVIEGAVEDEDGRYPAGTWFRLPPGSRHHPRSPEGCLLYVKVGHL